MRGKQQKLYSHKLEQVLVLALLSVFTTVQLMNL